MNLQHFSSSPVTKVRLGVQETGWQRKPVGLWVSDESEYGWSDWCQAQGTYLESLAVCHQVELEPDAQVTVVRDLVGMADLSKKYAHPQFSEMLTNMKFADMLDWDRLANDVQGLIITPCQSAYWMFDPNLTWYMGWDCASGCIWDPQAIKSIEVIDVR